MENPKVSIIIPVYNGSNFLEEAINSALSQTYTNCEIIVVNDGSNDGGKTEKIAKSYGNQIRYFYKENGGVASALNLALAKIQGEYFSWLSHDDLYYPNKIQCQIEALQQSDDITRIAYSDYDLLDMDRNQKEWVQLLKFYKKEKLEESVFCLLQQVLHGCTLLIHRSHFERIGNFNEELITTQDYDLWFKMFSRQKLLYIQESLVVGRLHKNQGSKKITCHTREREQLYTGFINEIDIQDKLQIYGSNYNFYYQMYNICKRSRFEVLSETLRRKLSCIKIPIEIYEKRDILKDYFNNESNHKHKKLCIFCAGEFGKELYIELLRRKIDVDIFCDNDINKQGTYIYSTKCVSLEELYEEREEILVIVANSKPNEIVSQLKTMGIKNVITKYEVDKILFDIPPLVLENTM